MITAKRRETVFIAVDIGTVISTSSSAMTGAEGATEIGEDVLDKSDYFWMPPLGKKIEKALDGGLLRQDGKVLYPVRGGIPIMLIDEAILIESLPA